MLQRFASALFGDDVEELRRSSRAGDSQDRRQEEEDDDDWILVNYLADTCSASCGPALSGSAPGCEDDEGEDDLVMVPSPTGSPPLRYASCTSLDSTADTEPDCGGGGGGEEEEDEEACGFLRLDAASLEESWFVTPPPCFTGRGGGHTLLEPSPLENLLIEHPSMSVYARRSPPRLPLDPLPRSLDLDLELELGNLLPGNLPAVAAAATAPASAGKKGRRTMDGARHRPDAATQRRSGLHSTCYAAALSARAGLLQPRTGAASAAAAAPPVSRNALRRLNLLRPPKVGAMQLHQPSHRHLNF